MVRNPTHVTLLAITRAGNRLVAVGVHGVIIYSDDDGLTWRQARVPVSVTLTALSFPTSKEGWAVGHFGIVLHSIDGGKTWQKQLDGMQVNQMAMAAAQKASTGGSTAPGAAYAIRRARHFLNQGPTEPFLTIWAPDAKTAIVFGAYRMADKTTDGGKSWTDWSLHIGDKLSHNIYDATTIGTQICLAAEVGLVFCSSDHGQSFTQLPPTGEATLLGISPAGAGGLLAYGIAGSAYLSKDDGQTWKSLDFFKKSNITAGTILKSGALVLVDQAGNIFISRDHGDHFSMLPAHESMSLYGLVQAENGNVVLVGSAGVRSLPAYDFK